MTRVIEEVTVDSPEPGLVRVDHTKIRPSGVDVGRQLRLSRDNAGWLAAAVRSLLVTRSSPRVEGSRGDDHFELYVGGREPALYVHVRNRRADGWEGSIALERGLAESLVEKLESL